MNLDMLKAKISERELTEEHLANLLKIHRTTFHRKLQKQGETFTVSELKGLMKVLSLNLRDAEEIFFGNIVQ